MKNLNYIVSLIGGQTLVTRNHSFDLLTKIFKITMSISEKPMVSKIEKNQLKKHIYK